MNAFLEIAVGGSKTHKQVAILCVSHSPTQNSPKICLYRPIAYLWDKKISYPCPCLHRQCNDSPLQSCIKWLFLIHVGPTIIMGISEMGRNSEMRPNGVWNESKLSEMDAWKWIRKGVKWMKTVLKLLKYVKINLKIEISIKIHHSYWLCCWYPIWVTFKIP